MRSLSIPSMQTVLIEAECPLVIVTAAAGNPSVRASNFSMAALALPFSGGTCIRTLIMSPCKRTEELLDPGSAFIFILMLTGSTRGKKFRIFRLQNR